MKHSGINDLFEIASKRPKLYSFLSIYFLNIQQFLTGEISMSTFPRDCLHQTLFLENIYSSVS